LNFKDFAALNFGNLIVLSFENFGEFDFEDLEVHDINDFRICKVHLKFFDNLTVNNFVWLTSLSLR